MPSRSGLEGVGGGPDEGLNPEVLFDRLEEDLYLPAVLVDGGDGGRTEREMVREKGDGLLLLLVPYLYSSQGIRILLLRKIAVEGDDLVFQDVPVLRDCLLFTHGISGIALLSRHKEDPTPGPSGKEDIVNIAPVKSHDGSLRKGQLPCDVDLMNTPFGDMGKDRKIPVMIEEEMKLDSPLR